MSMNARFYLSYDVKITLKSYFWRENIRLLGKRSLSFNNVMITLTSAPLSTRIVELASGVS